MGQGFPKDFLLGVATSAYQIEGSPLADGAGPSNWHVWCQQPGRIFEGHTGEVACDHYRRYREDVALMAQLGVEAYRFSVAWSRVLPEGVGAVNPRGLDFYQRLVDELLKAGIGPMVTLFHWDLPQALAERGGWANPDTARYFADYAGVVFRALQDRVSLWATLNEPWVVMDAGYVHGVHPPGLRDPKLALRVAHHLLLGHSLALQQGRALGAGQVGLVVNLEPKMAASEADRQAQERAHAYQNQWFLDPLFFGRYPPQAEEVWGPFWEELDASPLSQGRPDFVGINYYTRGVVGHDPGAPPPFARRLSPPPDRSTAMGWEVYPQGLAEAVLWVQERYGAVPLYITENGAAFPDPEPQQGRVRDAQRVAYLREHLQVVAGLLAQGVNLKGYFVWSFLDNFEWSFGFSKRFGLVFVDFATQERTVKDSGWFYREVIASRGANLTG